MSAAPLPPVPAEIDVTITHLEMLAAPKTPALPQPVSQNPLVLMVARNPNLRFYRFLYGSVGDPWLWYERRKMEDAKLSAILNDPAVEVTVAYVGGVPAGYFELDGRKPGEVELAYFGLMPDFIGLKLGPYFLDCAIRKAWARGPKRVWVHTCSLDHPKALSLYQRAGFVPFAQESHRIPNPAALIAASNRRGD
ncbi:MAG: GNAT family N-acetyltransferase [Elstera sp.]